MLGLLNIVILLKFFEQEEDKLLLNQWIDLELISWLEFLAN